MRRRDSLLDNLDARLTRKCRGPLRPLLGSLLSCTTHLHSCGQLLGLAGNGVGESVGTRSWLLDVAITVGLVCPAWCSFVRLFV